MDPGVDLSPSLYGRTLSFCVERQWSFHIGCLAPGCGHETRPSLAELASRFRSGLGAQVSDWAGRLRCALCGGRELKIYAINSPAFASKNHEGEAGRQLAFEAWLAEVDLQRALRAG